MDLDITVDSTDLAEALGWVNQAVASRPSVPVMAGVLLKANDDRLSVSSFNYQQSRQTDIPITDQRCGGEVLVSGRMLAELVGSFGKSQPVKLKLAAPATLAVACGYVHVELDTMPVEDYPPLPDQPAKAGTVDAAAFARIIAQANSVAGRDDTLPTMTGIQLDSIAGILKATATDRYRAGIAETNWKGDKSLMAVLVPARDLKAAAKKLAKCGEITIGFNGVLFGISADNLRATFRPLDGMLPPVVKLAPATFAQEYTVDRKALLAAARRWKKLTGRNSRVTLRFNGSCLTGSVDTDGEGKAATEQLACTGAPAGDDPGAVAAISADFLALGLAAFTDATVRFRFGTSDLAKTKDGPVSWPLIIDGDFRLMIHPLRVDA